MARLKNGSAWKRNRSARWERRLAERSRRRASARASGRRLSRAQRRRLAETADELFEGARSVEPVRGPHPPAALREAFGDDGLRARPLPAPPDDLPDWADGPLEKGW